MMITRKMQDYILIIIIFVIVVASIYNAITGKGPYYKVCPYCIRDYPEGPKYPILGKNQLNANGSLESVITDGMKTPYLNTN